MGIGFIWGEVIKDEEGGHVAFMKSSGVSSWWEEERIKKKTQGNASI